ncbi:MAG: hypothetical protein IT245_03235 [Bacteroidia bacterium]|nr:hypothetical protein [Bacteroidia bacterium]
MKNRHIWYLIILLSGINACRSSQEEAIVKGLEYFPIKIGDKKTYKIDTVVFDLFQKRIDTFSNIVYEEVVEQFVNFYGDSVYRIELSTFNTTKQKFVVFKSFERSIKDNYAIEKMDNSTEVKMIFPISNYKTKGSSYTWNANMFNNREPDIVKYTSVFTTFNNGINSYNNCVSIKLNKPLNGPIVNKIKEEVYAKDIGLVYRFTDSTDLLKSPDNDDFYSGKRIFIKLIN